LILAIKRPPHGWVLVIHSPRGLAQAALMSKATEELAAPGAYPDAALPNP